MVRPKSLHKTVTKTYNLYEQDITKLLDSGKAPKDIFRLGILALEKGWHPAREEGEIQDLKERLRTMSWTLQSYIDKFNKLAKIVEKGLNIKVDEEVIKTKELEEKLKLIEK